MTNKKFEHLATLCDCLAKNASTPEQRENLLVWPRGGDGGPAAKEEVNPI
jgi:hypothetical protein